MATQHAKIIKQEAQTTLLCAESCVILHTDTGQTFYRGLNVFNFFFGVFFVWL